MAFFSGDIDGNGGHDDLAKQIAYNGKEWTEKHWRMEDMEVCEFNLSSYSQCRPFGRNRSADKLF